MQKTKDPFAILGVSKTATDDEVQKAYRKKAMRCHLSTTSEGAISALTMSDLPKQKQERMFGLCQRLITPASLKE